MESAVHASGSNGFVDVQNAPLSPKQFYKALGGGIGMNYIYECVNLNESCPKRIEHFRIGTKLLILPSEVNEWPQRLASH